MTEYTLSPNLAHQLEEVAQGEERSVSDLLNEIIRDYVARRREARISEESARFRAMHGELWANYANQYIAMRDGKVIDHDVDLPTLHQRIQDTYGNAPILIAPVTPEPTQEFRIRRPRLERFTA